MKLCSVTFFVLATCAVSYAVENHGPILTAMQPMPQHQDIILVEQQPHEPHGRQKRSLLLGAGLLGAGALGAGALGAGALGAGVLGAGALGAGALAGGALLGAKAGFIGGALASKAFHGHSYGGGYGYARPVYYESAPVVYRSYPSYYVSDEWW